MKKILVFLCVLTLLVGTYVITVAAADSNEVAKIGNTGYNSIAAAIGAVSGTDVITLQKSIADLDLADKTVYLDLNGCDVANVTGTGTLYCMDSKTDDYDATNDGGYGKITGTIADAVKVYGVPVGTVSTDDTETYPSGKLDGYLKVTENDDLSFHRVNLQLNSINLRTNKDAETNELNPSVYYTSAFAADAVVANLMKADPKNNTFGVALSVKDTDGLSSATELGADWKCSSFDATNFNAGNDTNATSTLLKGIMKESNPTLINQRNANLHVYGCAYIKIGEQYMFGATDSRNLQEVMAGKGNPEIKPYPGADDLFNEMDPGEQEFVLKMYKTYKPIMEKWENLENIEAAFQEQEDEVLKVLVIGNSHSNDATWLLYEVFKAERKAERKAGNTDQDVVLGVLYYGGANISHHRKFMQNNEPVYTYWKNGDYDGANADGSWEGTPNATAADALTDEQWDVVVMQQMNHRAGMDNYYSARDIKQVITYVKNQLDPEHQPEFLWHMVWTNPDQPEYFQKGTGLAIGSDKDQNYSDIERWLGDHKESFSNEEGDYDQSVMYEKVVDCTKNYIDNDTVFLGADYFKDVIPSCTAVEYAQDVLDYIQAQAYRDYTHLSDYGRLMVAYLWYAKLMGKDQIDAVNVNEIPKALHKDTSKYPNNPNEDGSYPIDQDMKDGIIAAVNRALKHPYELPSTETE